MIEYDPNLPQEFSHMPKRASASVLIIALALAAVFLLSALFALTRGQAPVADNTADKQQQSSSNKATPTRGE